jgi:four helix bundle protein
LSQHLNTEHRIYSLSDQVLRSGTSVGANIREAEYAVSPRDFVHKLSISLKEANETDFWLSLFNETDYIDTNLFKSLQKDCIELIKILTSSIKTIKVNNNLK